MKRSFICFAFLCGLGLYCRGQALSGIDDLGRVLPLHNAVGSVKTGKQVGLFYFLWQGDVHSKTAERVWDLSEIYLKTPDVFHDFNHPGWGGGAGVAGRYYFWGEPVYGYYRGDDYWVHLKNIQLLTDAGVDFLVIDATNKLIYPTQSDALFKAIEAVRIQGKNPPKVVYYTNTASGAAMQDIFDTYYREGAPHRYPDCWFYLNGKPLIIGLSAEAKGKNYEQFFTFRESQWPNEAKKENGWPWIEFQRPQPVYYNKKGEKEIINVSTAQHPNLDASMGGSAFYGRSGNWGRSFRKGSPGNPAKDLFYGYNIQEQWDFAIGQDVPFVFVTGWNEWIAGKWRRQSGDKNQALFVDQASPEYSRDIEPSLTAGLRDHYYMQLIGNIRRYKGTSATSPIFRKDAIRNWNDWKTVPAAYEDYTGDVIHRSHPGAQTDPAVVYTNTTGRNDLKTVKVVTGKEQLYFYASTVDTLTAASGDNWMTLWLNTDQSYTSGWYGYDYRVVAGNQLQRFIDETWQTIATVAFTMQGNQLMIAIPYAFIGVPGKDGFLELKWSDNMQKADPLDWYTNGDAAPGGRMNLLLHFK
ncbi:hypothetical protein [Niabella drilacis]|uniref:Uncharacterized protein n=1 Tax=Niabella drilacis (strain DSM 25811 / CCM 8410 / CCUG 62505 / LMG 26954 / E90) TaxID=1285928 RepID=A0A1G6IGF3_NIADE|nr:hypothetical protein [Niabella drilacis]SDC05637.1 hypothetical protein SAMN04487894_101215 [Niabella drilacis]